MVVLQRSSISNLDGIRNSQILQDYVAVTGVTRNPVNPEIIVRLAKPITKLDFLVSGRNNGARSRQPSNPRTRRFPLAALAPSINRPGMTLMEEEIRGYTDFSDWGVTAAEGQLGEVVRQLRQFLNSRGSFTFLVRKENFIGL